MSVKCPRCHEQVDGVPDGCRDPNCPTLELHLMECNQRSGISAAIQAENARNIAYNSARDSVIRSARRYHDIATTRPVVSAEWVDAWKALGADIEALDYVEREATAEPKDAT